MMSNGAQEGGTKAPGDGTSRREAGVTVEDATVRKKSDTEAPSDETSRREAGATVEDATVRKRVAPKPQVTRRHDVRQV